MTKVDVSLILPCYNEGPIFEDSIKKIILQMRKLHTGWEIIFVEDKGDDNTIHFINKFVEQIKNARAIYHNKNEGRGKSVSDGVRGAKGKICGYMDVDLEVSEKYIPLFIKEVEKGYGLVVGKRYYEGGFKSVTRLLSSKIYSTAVKIMLRLPLEDTEAGFKFFNKSKIIPELKRIKSNHWFWDTEICARSYWSGLKVTQLPVIFKRRAEKKTTVRLIPDTIDYIKNLTRLRGEMPYK